MTTGSAAPSKKRAGYWNRLRFLDTVEDERATFSNANTETVNDTQNYSDEDVDNEVVDNHTENVPAQPTQKKEYEMKRPAEPCGSTKQDKRSRKNNDIVRLLQAREEERNETIKRLDQIMETPEHTDEIDLFFQSMAATVKKFNPRMKTEAKMKVFNLIAQMEMQSHSVAANPQRMTTFNYDSSLSASTSAHSTYANDYYSDVEPVDTILNCQF